MKQKPASEQTHLTLASKASRALPAGLYLALATAVAIPSLAFSAEPAVSQTQVSQTQTSDLHRTTHVTGSTSMRSAFVDEDYKQSRSVGMGASLGVDHQLEDNLSARLAVGLALDTGTSQSTFSDEYKPSQGIGLLDAYLNWKPGAGFDLRGGAVNQGWMESPLLIGDVAFPAALVSWKSNTDGFFVKLSAEQAIPTSDTTHSMPRGKDKLPTADFERITLGADLAEKTTTVQAHVGHFAFNNLTSGIALESRYRGNSVTGVGDEGSSFVYDFSGIETGARTDAKLSDRLSGTLDASWLTNLRAPLDRSRAMRLLAETSYQVSPNLMLTPNVQLFRSESDSSPAYYNIASLAHNNRQGLALGMKLSIPRSQLDVEGSWVKARVIESNPFQSDFNGVTFGLRKSYDLF